MSNGEFLWPGYGENSRVLKWIFERCDGKAHAVETPIGRVPAAADLDTKGLDLPASNLRESIERRCGRVARGSAAHRKAFEKFGKPFSGRDAG